MQKKRKVLIQLGLVILILAVAVLTAKILASFRKPPEKKEQPVIVPLLEVVEVSKETLNMTIQGYGTVQPRNEVQVVPQVSGRVIRCHKQLVNGGFFKAGAPLVVIEPRDYKLAVQSAEAAVAQAQVALEQEKSEADVARQEWNELHPDQTPQSDLVFHGPQIRSAEAQLKAARAGLDKAKLDLERTQIKMPFDGRVVSTTIDAGQFVTAGAPVATVYRTDLVEISVPLENSELAWFDVPLKANEAQSRSGSPATVYADFAGIEQRWSGRLVRTEGQIDPRSRMVHVVVQIQNPFQTPDDQSPLTPGMFVRVEIQGREINNIFRLPRYAIHGANEIWLAEDRTGEEDETMQNKRLKIQSVQIVRMDQEYAYISEGLQDGDRVITSPLETITNGMTIRILTHQTEQSQENDS